ncbi:lytic transglycosylase domain-containing protein [Herbaspirillum sp. RU 5E]|nr:lytic transglycosylase domain-containing protein [Herbaspirillum sp. RU 5E]
MANNFTITISAIDKTTEVVKKINAQVEKIYAPFDNIKKREEALSKEVGSNRLIKQMEGVAESAGKAADRLRSMVAPLAAIFGLGSIAGAALLATRLGRVEVSLLNQATALGMSTQELQKWQGVAKLAGLSAEDMNSALSNVGEKLDNAFRTPETVRDMNAIGLQMHRLKNGSIDTGRALLDIAAAMEKQGNVETKKRIADAFGVSSLFSLLVQGRKAVQDFLAESGRLTKFFTPEEVSRAREYQKHVAALGLSFEGLQHKLGIAVMPAFERMIGVADRLVDKYGAIVATKVAEYAEKLAGWIDKTDFAKVADDVGKFVDKLGGLEGIAIGIAAITFAGPIASVMSLVAQLLILSKTLTGGAAAGATGVLGKLGLLARVGVVGALAHGGLSLLDPTDDLGAWMDSNVPGAAWVDNAASHIGLGRSYEEQSQAEAARLKRSGAPATSSSAAALFGSLERQYGLPRGLLDSVWYAESTRGQGTMISPKGAQGHFQFMPDTARQYGVTDPFDLAQSADGAARMYRDLLKQNNGDLNGALAGYNWGQGNLQKNGIEAAPAETREYIRKVRNGMGLAPMNAAQVIAQTNVAAPVAQQQGQALVKVRFENAPRGMTASVRNEGTVRAAVVDPGQGGHL